MNHIDLIQIQLIIEKMIKFDSSKRLPQNIIIKSAETQLYRIGLSFESYDYVIRSKYINPIIIFIITFLSLIKFFITLLMPEYHNYLFIIFGDYIHILFKDKHFYLAAILLLLLSLIL